MSIVPIARLGQPVLLTKAAAVADVHAAAVRTLLADLHDTLADSGGLGLLARAALGRLLVMPPHAHLAVETLALHLLLQRAQGLIDIVVANLDLNDGLHSQSGRQTTPGRTISCQDGRAS